MARYTVDGNRASVPRMVIIVASVFLALIIATAIGIRMVYAQNLRPVSASQRTVSVTVPSGSSVKQIAALLEESGVIRAAWAFEWYARGNNLRDKMQAGTYSIRPNQNVEEIASVLTQGRIATDLVTILPGQRIEQIKSSLLRYGFSEASVDDALNPNTYADHPALVDKPKEASLEGYLYPESFQKSAETTPEAIVRASLDEMHKNLTPDLRASIARQGLTVHEGVILASIIEMEVSDKFAEDKPQVAQVFLKRWRENIKLQSDPTALFGAIRAGVQLPNDPASAAATANAYESSHNTYKISGLPPTPISNVSASSLKAIANPANTDFLYFVAGDDGSTYFSRTLEEHQRLTREHCKKLCS